MDEKIKIFVYGTLKKGEVRSKTLEEMNAKYIDDGYVYGFEMFYIKNYFPLIVKTNDNNKKVYGEIYEIEEKYLSTLDIIEGTPTGLYKRVSHTAINNKEEKIQVELYETGERLINEILKSDAYEVQKIEDGFWSSNKEEKLLTQKK